MKCLIVEDDDALRLFLVTCVQAMGHDTVDHSTVAGAMRAMMTEKFDLLLVDYRLPDGTSVPVLDYFGATSPNSRTILLTGTGVFPNGEAAIFAPSVDWMLRKPVELQDLQAIIAYAERDAAQPALALRSQR